MKKLLALLSLVAFLAVGVNAQDPKATTAPEAKKETTEVKADAKATPSCCMKANKACCKSSSSKNCTAEQKAACAKAGAAKECSGHGHGKAEASEAKEDKSGLK